MTTAGWIIAIIWTVIVFALIAGAIYWFVTALSGRGAGQADVSAAQASAAEILDRRLAKGEITIEQYRELRQALAEPSPVRGPSPPPGRPADAPG